MITVDKVLCVRYHVSCRSRSLLRRVGCRLRCVRWLAEWQRCNVGYTEDAGLLPIDCRLRGAGKVSSSSSLSLVCPVQLSYSVLSCPILSTVSQAMTQTRGTGTPAAVLCHSVSGPVFRVSWDCSSDTCHTWYFYRHVSHVKLLKTCVTHEITTSACQTWDYRRCVSHMILLQKRVTHETILRICATHEITL